MSVNKVTLIGNLGKDPEVKYMNNGNAVANFSIATSESWKDKQTGEKKGKTEWHNIVVYGPLTDVISKYVKKGSKLYIEGKLQNRKWQDKEGNDRYTTEVVLQGPGSTMQMLNKVDAEQQQQQAPQQQQQPQYAPQPQMSPAPQMQQQQAPQQQVQSYGKPPQHKPQQTPAQAAAPVTYAQPEAFDDDLPF